MDDPARSLLASQPRMAAVVEAAAEHRLQLVLGLIEEPSEGSPGAQPKLVQHGFRLDAEYFYPASAVKLFAAVAALERLADLGAETGLPIDADTPMVFHPLFEDEELEDADPSNLDGGTITVRHEIRKLFLVSDNRAFNRLYELLGQDGLAASLTAAGLGDARIVHRLSEARSPEENLLAPRIDFVGDGWRHAVPERRSEPLPPLPPVPGLEIGRAYMADGEKIEQPMPFELKNRISLADLQRGLCMVVRPDVDCGGAGFRLSEADRALLLEAMSQRPRESTNPLYDPADYLDNYVKFLLPGLDHVFPPGRLGIYNKIGQAYGFTTENAYVVDPETARSFFLAVTLYTNANGVLNDDDYEYGNVALPFLGFLGAEAARLLLVEPRTTDP